MKKKILIVFVIMINLINFSYCTEELIEESKKAFGIYDFISEAETYTKDTFPELDLGNFINSSIKGNMDLSFIKTMIVKVLGVEITEAIKLMVTVLIVIIINSVCKAILENLGNEDTSKIVYLLQYLVLVILISSSFANILKITKETIDKLTNFMNLLVPLFTTLVLTTGAIASTNVVQPILLFTINFISNFCDNFLIPLLLISFVLGIMANASDKVQISGLSKFLKSFIVWSLGIFLTVFTCLLSVEGTLSSSVDGFTAKTSKAVVTNFIPVVGKILGDSVETVIGCSNILKNTVGFVRNRNYCWNCFASYSKNSCIYFML